MNTADKYVTGGERKFRCCGDGCWRTTARPYTDGWSSLSDWGYGIKDGFYCPAHADAIEKVFEDHDQE